MSDYKLGETVVFNFTYNSFKVVVLSVLEKNGISVVV